jgi:uncharacterized membrane protein
MNAHDPLWMRLFLTLHIAAGFLSFVLAPVALATAKGGKQHKRWGMVYLWSMGLVAGTALPMALYRPVLFLALVAIFSFYMAFSGYRVLRLKDLARGGSAEPVDWIAGLLTFAVGALLLLLGLFRPAAVQSMAIESIVFGLISMRISGVSLWSFVRKPKDKMFWWYGHLGNFIGSYIAAWTAFSAVTLTQFFGRAWYVWLWPTIVGVPAIVIITIYYRRKFAPRKRAVAAAF